MKQLFSFLLLIVLSLTACNRIAFVDNTNADNYYLTQEEAFYDFAILLSRAVSNEPSLRSLLKTEALKKFDKDFDVFYPTVKNIVVDSELTFQQVLLKYDYYSKLPCIEQAVPLLTILVPDWSWIDRDCFSVTKWDPLDSSIVVSYDLPDGSHKIIIDGQDCGSLPYGCFIDTPTLVIKSNERLIDNLAVRSSVSDYHFIDEIFDNSIETKGHDETVIHEINGAPNSSAWIGKTQVISKVANCYQQINAVPGAAHRDYIYYGMTSSISSGYIDNGITESVFRYRIDPTWDCYYESEDLSFNQITGTTERSDDYLRAFSWCDGHLEMCFVVNAGFETPLYMYDNCTPSEAFVVRRVKETRHYNWLGFLTSRVYFITRDCLASKWVYPSLKLFTWDIETIPTSYTVQVYEHDSGAAITNSASIAVQLNTDYTKNFDIGSEYYGLTMKKSYGVNPSFTVTVNVSTTKSYTDNDDNLGSFVVQYINPIALDDATYGIELNSYNTGKIEVCMVPTSI